MDSDEKRNPCCKFSILQEKEIIRCYQEGKKSMAAIGKEWKCDPSTIKNILKAYGVSGRTLSEARRNYLGYTLKEDIFEKIDTPDKAYWLGVLYSDGFISKTPKYTNQFGLSIAKKDVEWLEKFKKFLGYNGEIKYYKTGESSYLPGTEYARLLIGSNKVVADLEKIGVVEHKTKKIDKLPDIGFLDDFIRGYIDGDGSLRKDYPHITICGNRSFLMDIMHYFKIPGKLYSDKSIFDLHYSKKASEYLEKRLYKEATTYLLRKYKIAQRSFNSPLTLEDVMENPLNCGEPLRA